MPMTPSEWARANDIFHRAVLLPETARHAFIARECGDNAELSAQVESLVRCHRETTLISPRHKIPSGTRIGVYDIVEFIAAGGMGEVYRARDTKLNRDVAIKILPPAVTSDPDRLARFQREAQVLAALNHPNIAAIHHVEETIAGPALVMELVDGETLADRIARGPIPLDEALPIAKQIAEALEAAHEQGIIHRDLKPANIKVRPDGTVKVLDFGLAKLNEPNGPSGSNVPNALSLSPTITSPALMTGVGVLLGTAAYMSPEQAKGKPADKRSDVWAFGCVLYEMLTGTAAFGGETITDVLGAVVHKEPDWTVLPPTTPEEVCRWLRRCLRKDRNLRTRDIGDVRIGLEDPFEQPSSDDGRRGWQSRSRLAWTVAAVASLAFASLAVSHFSATRTTADDRTPVRFEMAAPSGTTFVSAITGGFGHTVPRVSPDGRYLAFTARDGNGKIMLWVKALASVSPVMLPGTEGAGLPFWSPDSRSIAFFTSDTLKRIDVDGESLRKVCDLKNGRGGTWNTDGVILVGSLGGSISRCSAGGGSITRATALPVSQRPGVRFEHRYPWFLPDGRHFLYFQEALVGNTAPTIDVEKEKGVFVGSLDENGGGRRLLAADTQAVYVDPGYLLFVRDRTLLAQRFDPEALTFSGEPTSLVEQLAIDNVGAFSVSNNQTLVYRTGADLDESSPLGWFDASGQTAERVGRDGSYEGPTVSPDTMRIAVAAVAGTGSDILILDRAGRTSRLTFDPARNNRAPVWSPDGVHVAYAAQRAEKWAIYRKRADGAGTEDVLTESEYQLAPSSWSGDGALLFYTVVDPKSGRDIWVQPLGSRQETRPLLNGTANEGHPQISADGRWIAYESNESGRLEVYVQSFPLGHGKWQVSADGGQHPRWQHDGRMLYFTDGPANLRRMVNVDIESRQDVLRYGAPHVLFEFGRIANPDPLANPFDVSPDGRRFLLPRANTNLQGASTATPATIVVNWTALLRK